MTGRSLWSLIREISDNSDQKKLIIICFFHKELTCMKEYALKMYYIKYLKEIRKVSDSTVKHYQEALRYISKYLVQKGKIKETIYEIQDKGELEIIKIAG